MNIHVYKAFIYPIDNEKKVIESYFNHGYKYDHIVSLLKSEHGIEMSVRTLKRRLKSYNLSRRVDLEEDGNFNQEYIRNLIWQEMQGAAGTSRYRPYSVRQYFPGQRPSQSARRQEKRKKNASENKPFMRDLVPLSGPGDNLRLALIQRGHII